MTIYAVNFRFVN